MKKFTKALVLLLTLAILCTGIILAVSADEAKAETVGYVANGVSVEGNLADAIAGADAGTTLTLLGNCTVSAEIAVAKTVTVDLNGYTLTTSVANAFSVSGATTVFTVTGTGNIALAGTLANAAEDGATINVVGTGVDGIEVNHSGSKSVEFFNLKSNTLLLDNIDVVAKKGAKNNSFIDNSGNSNITIKNSAFNLDFNNTGGWTGAFFCFTRVVGATHFTMEDSAVYTRNMFIDADKMQNGDNESISIKNSTVRVNDTESSVAGTTRLAIIFTTGKASGVTNGGVVNVYDSLFDCSGRMFASETANTPIIVNIYGSTLKNTWAGADQLAGSNSGNINRRFTVNLYNSESGNHCKILSVNGNLTQENGCFITACEPGVRVNLPSITTSTADTTGIKVPGGIFAASNKSDNYEWVYDPFGDPDAPYVLIDKTKTTVALPDYYFNVGFDGIYFNKSGENLKDNSLRNEGGTSGTENAAVKDAESYNSRMQVSTISGGVYYLGSEAGNAYFKHVVTNEAMSGNYMITGKNTKTQSDIDKTSFANKVIVNEFDFGADSSVGFPKVDVSLQCRAVTTSNEEANLGTSKIFAIEADGKITTSLNNPAANAYTKLDPNEWYRMSVVFYPETNTAYVYINGIFMGSGKGYTNNSTLASSKEGTAYFQGVRFGWWSTNTVNATLCVDNVSSRTYVNYQNSETAETLSASVASNYIIASSPRKYIGTAVTVNGNPVSDIAKSVADANRTGSKINVNGTVNLGDFNYNAVVDFNGNKVTFGDASYGFAKNGTNYTFNENYWYNAYKYTGDINKLANGTYDESDFTLVGKVKLGYNFNVANYYIDRVANYVNLTVDTQNGWVYDMADTVSVLPKNPDLSDLEIADENKNVYYLPLLDAVPMAYVVKDAGGNIVSYGITNDEANNAFRNPINGTTMVLLKDFTVNGGSDTYVRLYNAGVIVTTDGVKTVNGVVIDNDYTDEEIATMRAVAADYRLDLNGNTLDMNKYHLVIGQNVEYSIYSSAPGAAVNMLYLNGTNVVGARTFNMAYIDPANPTKWQEGAEDMPENMNSRYNFGTYTDRNGEVVESEMFAMTGDVIFEAASGDSSCSFNVKNITANRVSVVSWATIVTRCFDGKINVSDSIMAAYGISKNYFAVHVMQDEAGTMHPEIVFDSCLFISDNPVENVINNGGPSTDRSVNVIFNNCISNARLNAATRDHVYFGEGTASQNMLVGNHYTSDNLIEAYCWEPMTVGAFGENGAYFVKLLKPVYDSATGTVNYDNYAYFVNNGYGATFEAEYPGVAYYELPVLTTKIVDKKDAVRVSFNRLDGSEVMYAYYEKGTDVQMMFVGNNRDSVNNWDLKLEDRTYTANAVTLTYTDYGTLPTNVQEDVVINPNYTVKANVSGLKANLSLYADFDVNVYIPAIYKDYVAVSVLENAKALTEINVGGVDYLMVTVSQKCNMAGDAVVFAIDVAEEVNGKLCEANATVSVSIASYATAVLGGNFTDADKVLMYYMLNYANEAEKYIDGAADANITAALENAAAYAEMYAVSYNYDKLFDTDALSGAFEDATLDIESTPAFVFTLADGFEGTVTVTYGGGLNERVYNVTAMDSRKIVVEGMKVYNFGTILTITANGTVNGEAVSVEGNYSLDNFANYHNNNTSDEASVACMPLVKALFAYAEVAELYKTNALADALVGAAE